MLCSVLTIYVRFYQKENPLNVGQSTAIPSFNVLHHPGGAVHPTQPFSGLRLTSANGALDGVSGYTIPNVYKQNTL